MVKNRYSLGLGALCLALAGCNVESTSQDTGGVTPGEGECPDGVSVLLTDFISTQVALSELEGQTQSSAFISSASTEASELAFALSGDVVLPSEPAASGHVVVLDRFGTNVVTWIDPESAEVVAQLPVGTGFESNPQDYLEVGDDRAFVTRWGQNAMPGEEPHDEGGDILVLDLETFEIEDSVPLPMEDELPPRPGAMTRLGDRVIVTLGRLSEDFATTGTTMLVSVSVEEPSVLWQQELDGLKGCGKLTPSPDGETLALACTGELTFEGDVANLDESAIVLFDAASDPLEEIERYSAEELVGEPLQSEIAYADDSTLLFKTQTALEGETNNRLLALDLDSGDTTELLEARPGDTGGKGVVYGGMSCAPGCSNVCLLADADRGVLQRVEIDADGEIEILDPIAVEDDVGLPPRDVTLR